MPEVRKLWQTEGLFSDHYLKARLKKNDWWPSDADAQSTFQFCRDLYEKRAFALRRYDNEMGVRQEFIDKILERLRFAWSDNLRLPETKQDLEPDYILYPDGDTKESVLNKSVAERYRAGVGILEAKKFGHPLSRISKHQQRYPHQQIRDYLQESDSIVWGILTNGEVWRLYCRDSKASHYFALNFEVALKSLEDFKIFLALFSAAAFTRDVQGKCRLDQVRESALATQAELEADLRERIFTIVEILANGFAERPENKITDADLPRLYETCLIFLYRLLFILYAEGRLLLPVEPKSRKYYKQLSLARLLTPLKNFTEYDSQTQTRFYHDIHALCLVINGTDKKANDEFGVPRYNGGLFDADRYPLLKEWAVADAVLADVLRQLMFTPEKGGQKFVPFESVDYADLSVQQLGSIYEGLLEHRFVRERSKLVLKTDKAERKATGTYYTPDYVVKYIVEQTITPLLQEIEQRDLVKTARAAAKQDNSFAGEVLKLNICDPAMGSGHFLVEATTFLADHIVYHPTTKFQAEFVKGESQEETEIAHWRRRVVEACIYGVDLNPLAVELAKLSLWLTTISTDQPLNFLDHHLRCGNSLIGARLDQLGNLPQKKAKGGAQQIHFTFGPDFKQAVAETIRQIHEIEGQASIDVATVKAKEKRWEVEILPRLAPYKQVADLWTDAFFDGPLSEEDYLAAARAILIAAETSTDRLQEAAGRYHIKEMDKPFFHWELEFPEVFFDDDGKPKGNPGFDAVIGNPPWGAEFDAKAKAYNRILFAPVIVRMVDSFMFFIYREKTLTRPNGFQSLIVPSPFFLQVDIKALRRHLLNLSLRTLVNLGDGVFGPNVTAPSCIFVVEAKSCVPAKQWVRVGDLTHVPVSEKPSKLRDSTSFRELPQDFYLKTHNFAFITKGFHATQIVSKAQDIGWPLAELIDGEIQRGISADYNDAFIVTDPVRRGEKLEPKICLPVLTGQNIARYILPWNGEHILYLTREDSIAEYPRAQAHLSRFRHCITCKEVKEGKHPWYALHRARSREIFRANKIVGLTTTDRLTVALDDDGYLAMDALYVFNLDSNRRISAGFLLALMNSRLLTFIYRYFAQEEGRALAQVKAENLYPLPIRRIEFTASEKSCASLIAKAKQLYARGVSDGNADSVLAFVAEQLAAKPERADVLHDLLAFLAEQMTTLNREKRAAAKQFLTDLKDFHGIDTHALKPKTKLDKFWKLEAAEVFAHFRANKLRLKDSDEEKIRARFQKAKDTLVLLETSLAFTDALIDEIVYRLYGLTAEEIKLVKETSRP
ncbi:MAG: N-6 DNA methylase [Chloroflexi bacterium]|nr:N-6 DNA methylase [Chloroflexota bacterium]